MVAARDLFDDARARAEDFDIAAAVRAHPFIALAAALGAGALYAFARSLGRTKRGRGDALGALAVTALAGIAERMVRSFAIRAAVTLWRAPTARA
jgi:hypothetical protein